MTPRRREAMPSHVAAALDKAKLREAYDQRPPYQRNDYLRWIRTAVQEATRQKRLAQMLDELKRGDRYMNMDWRGPDYDDD